MQHEPQNIDINKILELSSIVNEASLGSDFILGEADGTRALSNSSILETLKYPIKFDGYILFFLQAGHFKIDFNLSTYEVHERSMLVTVPGNIIRIEAPDSEHIQQTRLIFVVFSKEFISELHLDFTKTFHDSLRLLNNPCITLDEEHLALAESYFNLARQIVNSSHHNKRQLISGLLSSLSYLADEVWSEQIEHQDVSRTSDDARIVQIYDNFISLVTQYHLSQRNMQFYADKLYLSPKYLSKIIKQASGRSGPEWIDAFVILEAKNMLRHSDISIKDIVYRLNFSSSSVFNKFFRLHTGMSPSDYRKGRM